MKLLGYQCCEEMVSAMTFSCWQRQNTPEEKTLILVLFIQLGAMSCQVLINVFRKQRDEVIVWLLLIAMLVVPV